MDKEIPVKPFVPKPHSVEVAPLPAGKIVAGHKVTIEGYYLAAPKKRDAAGGYEKRRVSYRETFELGPSEHRVHGQGALGHLLSDEVLAKRLAEKDPEFRAVCTHTVVAHENVLADAPKTDA